MELVQYQDYEEYKKAMNTVLNRTVEDFVMTGYLLKQGRDTDILKNSGYNNVNEFAWAEYKLEATQVSRYIRINDRFSEGGYSPRLQEHYKGFGYAKLALMLTLPESVAEELTPAYSKGWTLNAIGGILGNMEKESNINPGLWQSLKEGNYSGGFGLVQWTPATNYTNWANSNGYGITDPEGQMHWIDALSASSGQWIATSAYSMTWGAYKNSKESPEYLASAFLKNFERAGVEVESERRSAARKWYDYLTKYADGSQVIEKAVEWAISIANDNSHGYDQAHRDGPDYDCSSLICWAYYNAGLNTRPGYTPATGAMYDVFLAAGFKDVTSQVNLATGSGLIRGDVLLKPGNHTEMSIGNGQLVAASQNEFGGITGGQTGDQTGKEIHVHGYYNFPWKYVLRYPGGGVAPVQGLYIVRWIPG